MSANSDNEFTQFISNLPKQTDKDISKKDKFSYKILYICLGTINEGASEIKIVKPKISKNMAQISGRPLAGKVLVKAKEAETKTAGGIIIPDSAKEKPLQGEVIAVGGAKKDEIVEVKVGDNVLYAKYSGVEISLNGVDYLLLNQSDILFIL